MKKMSGRTVIDGDGLILGRLASTVAKRLLAGEAIDIVNAEKIVVSGKRNMIVGKEKEFLEVGGFGKGPIHYRQPHRKSHGRDAYRRLRVHIGVPRELEAAEKESIPEIHSSNLSRRFVSVGEIAESIGWKK